LSNHNGIFFQGSRFRRLTRSHSVFVEWHNLLIFYNNQKLSLLVDLPSTF